jgi:hypothetical protein
VVALRMSVGDGDVPVVRLAVEAGTPPLDTLRHGIRWTRDAS